MDSLGQAILKPSEISAAAALHSLKFGIGAILGPSLGGILVSTFGAPFAYGFDFATFFFSVFMLFWIDTRKLVRATKEFKLASSLVEGLKYALGRQEILGTYIVDICAMALAFPMALFPALSQQWHHPEKIGLLYSALTAGSLIAPLFSGWAGKVQKQGQVILFAAAAWGVGVALFGLTSHFWVGLVFLFLASIADTISGLFRAMIWNQTIPNEIRGRLAGLELMSYMSGPLLGNARAGWVASAVNTQFSLVSGGILCSVCILVAALLLPKFRKYAWISPQTYPTVSK
jgi:MFS family permease